MPDETTTPDPSPAQAPTPADCTDPANLPDTVEALQDNTHSLTRLMASHSHAISYLDGYIALGEFLLSMGLDGTSGPTTMQEDVEKAKENRMGHYNEQARAFAQRSALYDRLYKLTNPPAPCPEMPDLRTP